MSIVSRTVTDDWRVMQRVNKGKKKILIVMGGFFPGKKLGGPPVSVDNFCSLMDNYACYIVTKNHDMNEKQPYSNIEDGWNSFKNYRVMYLPDTKYNIREFRRVILEVAPDIIYLQGLFQSCVIPMLVLAKKNTIATLLAPRGELCAGAFKKKYKKMPYIMFLRICRLTKGTHFQATSDEELHAIEKHLRIKNSNIHFLTNIPSFGNSECFSNGMTFACKKRQGHARIIFLSRLVRKKNLHYLLLNLREITGNIELAIYGTKEDMEYWNECEKIIKSLPSNIHVSYKGNANHAEVHNIFSEYDAFVFPTQSENYGHVIVESISSGTPVIISDQTPWSDAADAGAGWVIPLNKEEDFVRAINDLINFNADEMASMREQTIKYAMKKMNLAQIKRQYEEVFDAI